MKYKVNNIKVPIEEGRASLFKYISKKIGVSRDSIKLNKIIKESVDARKKNVKFIYSVILDIDSNNIKRNSDIQEYKERIIEPITYGNNKLKNKPVIVGFGPAGMFAGLFLSKYGFKPIIIERGEKVEKRTKSIKKYWESNILDEESNIQFGEGGAGTFSDGKLNSRINDYRCDIVLDIMAKNGAPEDILYLSKPHVGTDKLQKIVKNIRKEIEKLGGEFYFSSKLTDIKIENNIVCGINYNNQNEIDSNIVILAIGHSARDTFEMLNNKNIYLEPKSFSVGYRIEHPREYIDKIQYGEYHKYLRSAEYQLFYKFDNSTIYTFCMCPGGKVVASASEKNSIVTNGMSYYNRNDHNSNSAVVVSVDRKDFLPGSLGGINFQREIEKKAFLCTGGAAPVQRLRDFLDNKKTKNFGRVLPSYTGKIEKFDLNQIMKSNINDSIKIGLLNFDKKLKGFIFDDAILTGVETRTSSPVRILRDSNMQSVNCKNLYPIGEGAGYAGGIMSAAVDGMRVAEAIVKKYTPDY